MAFSPIPEVLDDLRAGKPIVLVDDEDRENEGDIVYAHTKFGVTTGISAFDRAKTIEVAIADDAQPHDLLRPGHTNPLRAADGGVLVRAGHTEGGVDLARLAGLKPAAVICEIVSDDGTMARRP